MYHRHNKEKRLSVEVFGCLFAKKHLHALYIHTVISGKLAYLLFLVHSTLMQYKPYTNKITVNNTSTAMLHEHKSPLAITEWLEVVLVYLVSMVADMVLFNPQTLGLRAV